MRRAETSRRILERALRFRLEMTNRKMRGINQQCLEVFKSLWETLRELSVKKSYLCLKLSIDCLVTEVSMRLLVNTNFLSHLNYQRSSPHLFNSSMKKERTIK